MAWPEYLGDIEVYQRDGLTGTLTFVDADGDPIDVSGSTFTGDVKGENGGVVAGVLAWSFDMASAGSGVVGITLDADDCMAVTGPRAERVWYLTWDITEAGLWDQTLYEGRIALRTPA